MKKKAISKLISVLLTAVMLLSLLPLSALAAAEVVLFEDDFENLSENARVTTGKAWNQWTDEIGLDITHGRAQKEGDNTVIQFFNADGEKMRGPRFEKTINASQLTNMTITYKAKTQDANLILQIWADGEDKSNTSGIITVYNKNAWGETSVTIQFADLTYTVNGKKAGTLKPIRDLSTFTIRFTQTLSDASFTWLDDVKITTTDNVDPANLTGNASAGDVSELAPVGPELDPVSGAVVVKSSMTNKPPAVRAAGKNILFEDDAEGYSADGKIPTGSKKENWTDYTSSANSIVGITDNGGNKVISYGNPSPNRTYPRIEKLLEYNGLKTLHIQFSVKPHDSNFSLALMSNGELAETLVKDTTKEDWRNYSIIVDVENSKYSVKLNGSALVEMREMEAKISSPTNLLLRFSSISESGRAVYLDNLVISTPDDVSSAQLLVGNEGENYFVNFENLSIPNPDAAISPSMLRAHPRIFVTDWEEMRQKAKSTPEFESWYGRIKAKAAEIMAGPTEVFVLNQGATLSVLQQARNLYEKIFVLGLVYNVEQDPVYAERAWKEIDATNHFDHWSPTDAYLATAEMSFAYAVAYDWFYYAFTDAQKAEMIAALKEKCFAPLVFNYEGKKTGTNFTTSSVNWNNVCNGSSAIVALSMYEEFPQIAEYILQKAMTYIQYALPAFAPEGAYAEGPMYWGLCIDYTVRMMAAVDSAFANSADIPENYILYNAPGLAQTADFPVYYSAYTGSFNYGDATIAKAGSDVMYWFASKFKKPQHAWYERNLDYENGGPSGVLGFIWYDGNAVAEPGVFKLDRFYHHDTLHNGISMRSSWENDDGLFVSMMGGYNSSGHQFLANGTFMLESKGIRWITMRGAGNYSYTDYFDSTGNDATRWTYYVARAEGQNTIIANPGVLADQNYNAVGKLIASGSATNEAFGIIDITSTNTVFESAKRGVFMKDNRSRVIIQDELTTKEPSEIYWFAHTLADITLAEDGKSALLEMQGEKMLVRIIEGPAEAKLSVYDSKPLITSPAPQGQNLSYGKKLAIRLTNVSALQLAVEFVPLEKEAGVPAPSVFEKLDTWKVTETDMLFDAKMGDAIALLLNSPVAFGGGRKMYVDQNNYEVVPFTENGRTLVPVRFIAESFGAEVGWDAETQTVSVYYLGRDIRMQIGSNIMTLNGEKILLDVPANTYNSRTLIPLRALSEALGKEVLWDDRGLIVIDDAVAPYTEMKDEIIACLDYRITLDGAEMTMFDANKTEYYAAVSPSALSAPVVGFSAVSGIMAEITQAATPNGTATVTVNGKTYTLHFVTDAFAARSADKASTNFAALNVKFMGEDEMSPPTQETYIKVTCIAQSAGDNYALTNTVDNDLTSRWSAEGDHWLTYDLGYAQQVGGFALATMNSSVRAYKFELQYSHDNVNWKSFYSDTTRMLGDMPDQYIFEPVTARYIRLVGHGFQGSPWNSYTEVRFYTDAAQAELDARYFKYYFAVGDFSGKVGESGQMVLDCKIENGAPVDMTKAIVRFKSSDEKVAVVDQSGKVTLVGPGTARIGIEVSYGGYTKLESKYVECK